MEIQTQNPEIKSSSSAVKKVIFLILALVLLASVYFIFFGKEKKDKPGSNTNDQTQVDNYSKVEPVPGQVMTPSGELPKGVTQEMIVDKNAVVSKAFEYTDEDGTQQSTVIFVSSLSLDEVEAAFKEYFAADGWFLQAGSGYQSDGSLSLTAIKAKDNLMVTAYKSADEKTVKVDLTLVSSK